MSDKGKYRKDQVHIDAMSGEGKGKKFDDDKAPVVQGCFHYFPRALQAVTHLSKYGLEKYDLEYDDKNFMKLDPDRIMNAIGRHLMQEAIDGMYDEESNHLHAIAVAWEALARLEILLDSGLPQVKA